MATTETTPVKQKTEVELRREAVAAAEKRLREGHRDEYDNLVQEEATRRGVTYQRRLTEEEKAEAEVRRLLAAHPSLVAKVAQQDTPPA